MDLAHESTPETPAEKRADPAPRLDLDTAPRWLIPSEAAQCARVSTRTIRSWASLGYIRVSRPAGGRAVVDRDSLRAFIEGSAS